MKVQELFDSKLDIRELVEEFMKAAEKNVRRWFGSGTFDEICSEAGNCAMVSEQFSDWLHEKGVGAKTVTVHMAKNKAWPKRAGVTPGSEDDAHTAVVIDNTVVDLTARQFDSSLPYPRVISLDKFRSEWAE